MSFLALESWQEFIAYICVEKFVAFQMEDHTLQMQMCLSRSRMRGTDYRYDCVKKDKRWPLAQANTFDG
jgi:hypothetical protein